MKFVQAPWAFDVVVASNLQGDILTDLAAVLSGGMGVAPSCNLNPDENGMPRCSNQPMAAHRILPARAWPTPQQCCSPRHACWSGWGGKTRLWQQPGGNCLMQ